MSNTYVYFNGETKMYGFSRRWGRPNGYLSENNKSLEILAGAMVILESSSSLDGKLLFKEEFRLINKIPPSEYIKGINRKGLRRLYDPEFRRLMNALKALRAVRELKLEG